jgi:hypothetical protein
MGMSESGMGIHKALEELSVSGYNVLFAQVSKAL